MAFVHVYPQSEKGQHNTAKGVDCWCEPEVRDEGTDANGQPARVFVHRKSTHEGVVTKWIKSDEQWKPPKRRLGRG